MKQEGNSSVVPFLKWAGGKRWLIEREKSFFSGSFTRFIEPFLGGGSVFFHLQPSIALLSDSNEQLIQTYEAIRDEWQEVERLLRFHHRRHSVTYYYKMRGARLRSSISQAAQFIYLNRTCWNGLYRVNLQGAFNVPIGTKTNVVLDTDDFEGISRLLQNVTLTSCDFEQTLKQAGSGDFAFVDPPYTVKHNNNGFVKYNEGLFSWDDQVRLRDAVVAARDRGAKVVVTNANHQCLRDLYHGVGQVTVMTRKSVISGSASARGEYEELVVSCG
jgi:DNA adenine methylase